MQFIIYANYFMTSFKLSQIDVIEGAIEPKHIKIYAKTDKICPKRNKTGNKARQTHHQDNEKHTNTDKINTNNYTTYPKPDEILSISKERDIN